jgi:hypothetical protein
VRVFLFCCLCGLADCSNDFLEYFRFVFCEVGEDLAVDLDAGNFEGIDEPAVAKAFGADRCVDLDGPELAEGALLFFAATERVDPCVEQGFFGGTLFGAATPLKALGVLKGFLTVLMGIYSSFYAWHGSGSIIN